MSSLEGIFGIWTGLFFGHVSLEIRRFSQGQRVRKARCVLGTPQMSVEYNMLFLLYKLDEWDDPYECLTYLFCQHKL